MNLTMLWPLTLVVVASVFYSVSSKSVPQESPAPAVLVVTYLTAATLSFLSWFFLGENKNFLGALGKINWTGYALGLSMVGLEIGYIFMYRAGWKISTASLLANCLVAVALLLIGLFFYREHLSLRQFLGIIFCLLGSVLIMGEK